MENETSPEKNSWLSDVSWKAALIYVVLSVIGGGATGAGVIATKAVSAAPQTSGITQDQADVRYLPRSEAETRRDSILREVGEVKKAMLTREVYEANERANAMRMERMEKLFERFLENQNSR